MTIAILVVVTLHLVAFIVRREMEDYKRRKCIREFLACWHDNRANHVRWEDCGERLLDVIHRNYGGW